MPPSRVRQLYNTVTIPTFTYAADVWYTGIHKPTKSIKNRESIAVTNKLVSVQRRVAKLITSSLSSTAGDIMDAHANLLPVDPQNTLPSRHSHHIPPYNSPTTPSLS